MVSLRSSEIERGSIQSKANLARLIGSLLVLVYLALVL